MKLAIAGVGNNASALIQGICFYREIKIDGPLPGVARTSIAGMRVTDIDVVAAFDLSENKVNIPVSEAIFATPNNYPDLGTAPPHPDPQVSSGISDHNDEQQIKMLTAALRAQEADVLLYSLPTGLPEMARAYGTAALDAGVAVVNCTPDPVANLPELRAKAAESSIPLVGDDLQSHFGSSIVHGALLALLEERGLSLTGSYQVNLGGNADFQNLRYHGDSKMTSKHRALRQKVNNTDAVTVIPSGGFIPHLCDRKVAHISIEARGWGNMPVAFDATLQVQDSSNAAGVIIDLVRIASAARDRREGGFPVEATSLLKSPTLLEENAVSQGIRGRELLARLSRDDLS